MSGTIYWPALHKFQKKLMKIRSLIIPIISKTKQFKRKPFKFPSLESEKLKQKCHNYS